MTSAIFAEFPLSCKLTWYLLYIFSDVPSRLMCQALRCSLPTYVPDSPMFPPDLCARLCYVLSPPNDCFMTTFYINVALSVYLSCEWKHWLRSKCTKPWHVPQAVYHVLYYIMQFDKCSHIYASGESVQCGHKFGSLRCCYPWEYNSSVSWGVHHLVVSVVILWKVEAK